jgi:uncharacterized protein YecE (DUF72 family)
MPELRIGCSGFSYQHWRGLFYPENLGECRWLEYYSSIFSTVELNVTFYRLPRPVTFNTWYKRTPPDFGYSVKGSRFITHVKKLLNLKDPLKLFFDRALRLQEKLKVVLWQFPPSYKANRERLVAFVRLLKKSPYVMLLSSGMKAGSFGYHGPLQRSNERMHSRLALIHR